jgi:iron complex outermembrane receptor protein
MKNCLLTGCLLLFIKVALSQDSTAVDSFYLLEPVEVRAVRAGALSPFTRTNITREEIKANNLGQDIPFLLNQVSSVVINSDAGNGIGYTGIRIRGTDATRINITLNGIPYNDAESQGSFFVDLPDFSSSTGSIQVQRGVGTSSNGAGAFGASIHFSTNEVNRESYAEINTSAGSFNTWKNTFRAGTGLLDDRFTADVRLSRISSDGFIDRSASKLRSWFASLAWLGSGTNLRLNVFSGNEKTGQAWYGISENDLLAGNRTINYAGTEKPGAPYENETDNYRQDHYQFFFDQQLGSGFHFNTALFLTHGKGYYEQYKAGESYADYGINTAGHSDFIRQLWLENDYYGAIYSVRYNGRKWRSDLGGALTWYDGRHFGELIWASAGLPDPRYRWYDLDAMKNDFTVYSKNQYQFSDYWYGFADAQYRKVNYDIHGFRNNPLLEVNSAFDFFNPKIGITYSRNRLKAYASFGIARKEPNRDDFETNIQPRPENLYDWELGMEKSGSRSGWSAVLYHMRYKDQLVLTGRINDVGAYTRMNIPRSYRAGVELEGRSRLAQWISASANLSLSTNRIQDFEEYIDDYDNGGQKLNRFSSTDIAFSPSVTAGGTLSLFPFQHAELNFPGKYVSRQYLDNTGDVNRSLDPFYVQDLRASYILKSKWMKEAKIIFQVNNIFDNDYEPNGYTYNYIYGGELIVNNFYFPMAGRNYLLALNISL